MPSKHSGPVSLTVHRNTIERRAKRERAKALSQDVEVLFRERDLRAYAVVGIDATGRAHAYWDTGAVMPMWGFPETVAAILRRDMEASDAKEDWRPHLTTPIHLKG